MVKQMRNKISELLIRLSSVRRFSHFRNSREFLRIVAVSSGVVVVRDLYLVDCEMLIPLVRWHSNGIVNRLCLNE